MDSHVDEQPLLRVAATSVRKSVHTYNFFKIDCIKSKSAIVILLWTFLALAGYNVLNPMNSWILYNVPQRVSNYKIILILVYVVFFFFFGIMFISPMAGLLADIKFGRYKTLKCSSYITVV